ncbi:MAG: metallophosphoesterase [Bacteroidales bacterium]|nr:metallophosphoesterase [Bacteroidales bacterium]
MKKLNILTLILSVLFLSSLSLSAQKIFVTSVAPKDATHIIIDESNATRNFLSTAGSQTVEVETNLSLHVKSDQNWCKPQVSENGKGLTIAVEANTSENKRTAEVTVYGKDNKSAKVEVVQLGTKSDILVNEKSIEVDQFASSFTLGVTSSVAFTFDLPSWIKGPSPAAAIGFHNYEFTLDAITESDAKREGEIIIKPSDNAIAEIKIPVTQSHVGYPRFAVISDIHFGNNQGEGPMVKVPKALKNIFKQEPLVDALFVVGDLTEGGTESQYNQLMTVFNDETVVPKDMPVYYMMGNHDNYASNANENYFKLGQPLHQYIEIKGYPFITTSMNGGTSDGYGADAQNFLRESLADAAVKYPGKPIFVFTHVPPKGTVYGSQNGEGGWGTDKLTSILNNYPQAVVFSGHSHFPLGDPRSIHQDKFTAVNDGSTTYSEIEPSLVNAGIHPERYAYVTEGVIVNVDKDMNIEMERWDTYRNLEILPRWKVNAPHDGSNFTKEYKGRTGGEAPKFATGIKPIVSDIENESCKITFDQATDDEVVHHYVIEILDNGSVVTRFTKFSEFYLNTDMPLSFTISMNGIPTGKTLQAQVTALDSYKNRSIPIVSDEFIAGKFTPSPGSSKPAPESLVLDVVFKDGSAEDISPLKNTIIAGAKTPEVYLNETFNVQTAKFTGDNTCYYKVDYKDNQVIKDAFSNGFTFEAIYMVNNTSSTMSPISAQESGGAGIEQKTGFEFWVNIDKSYKTAKGGSVVAGKFYHVIAIYNKAAEKLLMYVDGKLAGETEAKGNLTFPENTAAQWIAIGGDAGTGSTVQSPMDGEIAVARMYNRAVTRDEVYWMYQDFQTEEPEKPIVLPNTFPANKLIGHWEFNDSGVVPVKADNGVSLTVTNAGGVRYVEEDGINAAYVTNSSVGGPTPNYLTFTHNLPPTEGTEVKEYCIVMDIKTSLVTSYLPLLWSHSFTGDADIFVKQAGSMGLQGGGLGYTEDGFIQNGWNRIVINANLSNNQLDFYVVYPNGVRKEYKKAVTTTDRFSLRSDSSSDIFRDNGDEDGDAYIAQLALFNTFLTDEEINGILVPWTED